MYKTNFDCNSTGLNIEVHINRDNWLARDWFDESVSKYELNHNTTLYVYNDFESKINSIGDFCTIKNHATKKELIELAEELNEWHSYEDYSMSDLREEILEANPAMILNAYWHESDVIKIKPEFDLYCTKGYCQGDAEYVLYKGNRTDASIQNSIDHLFWDSPISGVVTINGNEYPYCESDLDYYDWDRDSFIEWIMNHDCTKEIGRDSEIKSTLEELLPDDYVDYIW